MVPGGCSKLHSTGPASFILKKVVWYKRWRWGNDDLVGSVGSCNNQAERRGARWVCRLLVALLSQSYPEGNTFESFLACQSTGKDS